MSLDLVNILREGATEAEVLFTCPADEHRIHIMALTGGLLYNAAGALEPYAPAWYPFASIPIVVKTAVAEPIGSVWGYQLYIRVTYGAPKNWDQMGSDQKTLFTWSKQTSAQTYTLDRTAYKDGSNNNILSNTDPQPFVYVPQVQITATCPWMPSLKTLTNAGFVGKLNNAPFTIPFDNTWGTATLMFMGDSGEQRTTQEGAQYATRSLVFLGNPNGWNSIPKINGNAIQWIPVSNRYQTANLDSLFF